MKFGKQLELLSIAEWRSYYMSYRKLKRILKRLPAGGDDDDEAAGNRVPSISVVPSFEAPAGTSTAPLIEPLLPTPELLAEVERDFFAIIEEDIVRINGQSSQLRQSIEQRVQVLEQMAAAQTMRASPVSQSYVSGFGATLLVDARELTEAYCLCAKLRSFAVLNHDGLRKIVKKWDKTVGAADKTASARQPDIKARLANEPFMCTDAAVLRQCVTRLEALAKGPEQLAELRAAAQRSVNPHAQSGSLQAATTPLLSIALAAAVGAAVALLPLNMHKHLDGAPSHTGEDIYHAQRCLAVLLGVVVLWLTEALPYFVTSLLVPVLVVVANTIPHESVPSAHPDGLVTRADTAKLVLNSMFDKTIILVLSGLVAASAVARCQLEVRLAVGLQQALGTRPRALLLALMHLGLFTSMCISNVTAPILLLSVIKPILLELPLGSNYARALLLGLAFSCNLGGMLTPISSPQNAVALEALSTVGEEIAFGTWLALALPLVEIGTFSSWMVICLLYLSPCDVKQLPPLAYTPTTLRPPQLVMLACVCATVVAWAMFASPLLKHNLGDPAIVGLLLLGAAFGSGFLGKADFNGLSWHLLALIAGGNALGLAVSRSGLLTMAADAMTTRVLAGGSTWLVVVELGLALLVLTSFISHTVASIVVMPLIASIGVQFGDAKGVVFCCVLAVSAAMALPMSSFPNVNSLLAEDDYGTPYLTPRDFVRSGVPSSIAVGLCIVALGYPLSVLVL